MTEMRNMVDDTKKKINRSPEQHSNKSWTMTEELQDKEETSRKAEVENV